ETTPSPNSKAIGHERNPLCYRLIDHGSQLMSPCFFSAGGSLLADVDFGSRRSVEGRLLDAQCSGVSQRTLGCAPDGTTPGAGPLPAAFATAALASIIACSASCNSPR